jgi:hypothetical protein
MFEQFLAMRQVLRDQNYQSDQLRKLVRERLRAVLISAFEHTAYYRVYPLLSRRQNDNFQYSSAASCGVHCYM